MVKQFVNASSRSKSTKKQSLEKSFDPVEFLRILHMPDQTFEIRAPACPYEPGSKYESTASGYFDSVDECVGNCLTDLENRRPPGIYTTVNPVDPNVRGRAHREVKKRAQHTTSGDEVLQRRWLFFDIDSIRPRGTNATDEELAHATTVAKKVRGYLRQRGWPEPLSGMSGNGRYLFYRIDLPNNSESTDLSKQLLEGLHRKFSQPGKAEIDLKPFDAPRICKVLGTTARKGADIPASEKGDARPQRRSWFYRPPCPRKVVSGDQLRALADDLTTEFAAVEARVNKGEHKKPSFGKPKRVRSPISQASAMLDDRTARIQRATQYVSKMDESIDGQNGSGTMFRVACAMVGRRFKLTADEAYDVIQENYNEQLASPWSESELRHKISDAIEKTKAEDDEFITRPKVTTGKKKQKKARRMTIADQARQTDVANAEEFVARFGDQVAYVPPWGKWLHWEGRRWHDDSGVGVMQCAQQYTDALWGEFKAQRNDLPPSQLSAATRFVQQSNRTPAIKNFLSLAQSHVKVVCPVPKLNADPLLLNCQNGTVHLPTGGLRPHNPHDRLTQITKVAFSPDATCPQWEDTLEIIFDSNRKLIRYVQRLLGYSISGNAGEHILPIAYGSGNNGKSTIWNVVTNLLGDYASPASEGLLMGDRSEHPTELADLYQKRFVPISEPERGAKLKAARVKSLTGDSIIKARRCREDFWQFDRTHTFWMAANHRPVITDTDEGIWRRVKLIPFTVNIKDKVTPIPDFDKHLLSQEGEGILAWLVRGYRDYTEHGLDEPEVVTKATSKYRSETDSLGSFLDEYTIVEEGAEVQAAELFRVYKDQAGGQWTQKGFGLAMGERFQRRKQWEGVNRGKYCYVGIRLKTEGGRTS